VHRADNFNNFMCGLSRKFGGSQPSGNLRACPGLFRDSFTFFFTIVTEQTAVSVNRVENVTIRCDLPWGESPLV
jgi:hypothetical protein